MKKIYLSLMLLGAVAFTSCDMNTTPWGVLDEGTAIQTPKDLRKFRNQLYANLRGVTSGSWIYSTDIQMDEFIGLISNGNQLGEFSKGTFTVSDGSIEGFWGSGYAFIANCNALHVLLACRPLLPVVHTDRPEQGSHWYAARNRV